MEGKTDWDENVMADNIEKAYHHRHLCQALKGPGRNLSKANHVLDQTDCLFWVSGKLYGWGLLYAMTVLYQPVSQCRGLPQAGMALCWVKIQLAWKDNAITDTMCIRSIVGCMAILLYHWLPWGVAAKVFQAMTLLFSRQIKAAEYREHILKLLQQPFL